MTRAHLIDTIRQKQSYLCVGLDSDINKIPAHLLSAADPVFEFNKVIIDSTKAWCVSYKINTAFYESRGVKGWESLQKTIDYIPASHFTIADAKRGDIGNTSTQYAKAFFETLNFDAVTVAPYMGSDSIQPFLEFENKWTIVLGLTSNPGAADFELLPTGEELLYEKVIRTVAQWGSPEKLMFVIGATQAGLLERIRKIVPDHFFLVPGVGAQGGDLNQISQKVMNKDFGLLVNASRSVIFASSGEDFGEKAEEAARLIQEDMANILRSETSA